MKLLHHRSAPIAGGRPAAGPPDRVQHPDFCVGNLMGAAREQIGPQLSPRAPAVAPSAKADSGIHGSASPPEVNRRPAGARRIVHPQERRPGNPSAPHHGVRRGQTCAKIFDGEGRPLREAGQKHWLSGRLQPGRRQTAARWSSASGQLRARDGRQRIDGARVHHAPRGCAWRNQRHGRRGEPRHHSATASPRGLAAAVDEDADRLRLEPLGPKSGRAILSSHEVGLLRGRTAIRPHGP